MWSGGSSHSATHSKKLHPELYTVIWFHKQTIPNTKRGALEALQLRVITMYETRDHTHLLPFPFPTSPKNMIIIFLFLDFDFTWTSTINKRLTHDNNVSITEFGSWSWVHFQNPNFGSEYVYDPKVNNATCCSNAPRRQKPLYQQLQFHFQMEIVDGFYQ